MLQHVFFFFFPNLEQICLCMRGLSRSMLVIFGRCCQTRRESCILFFPDIVPNNRHGGHADFHPSTCTCSYHGSIESTGVLHVHVCRWSCRSHNPKPLAATLIDARASGGVPSSRSCTFSKLLHLRQTTATPSLSCLASQHHHLTPCANIPLVTCFKCYR